MRTLPKVARLAGLMSVMVALTAPLSPLQAAPDLVTPSTTDILKAGQRIAGSDYDHMVQPFIIQRLGQKTYWVHSHAYNSTVVIGDKGVMVIDAPRDGRGATILEAIRTLTDKPITTLVYSHYHFDHVGDANTFVADAKRTGTDLRIVGTQGTADQIVRYGRKIPVPTEIVATPNGTFDFEGMEITVGTGPNGHSDDSSWILLKEEGILHAVDMLHPTALVFPGFGMAEDMMGYEQGLKDLLAQEWTFLSAGHSNIGTRGDVELVLDYLQNIKMALGKAFPAVQMMPHVTKDDVFFTWFMNYKDEIVAHAMETLRPKWAKERAFETVTPANIEKVMWHFYMH